MKTASQFLIASKQTPRNQTETPHETNHEAFNPARLLRPKQISTYSSTLCQGEVDKSRLLRLLLLDLRRSLQQRLAVSRQKLAPGANVVNVSVAVFHQQNFGHAAACAAGAAQYHG